MASGLENIETIESPFRRFVTTIGVFPTAFTDAMTYYECLAYLVKYLEDTVVPAVNENAEALEELQTLYVQLKSYVDNYFENLDVQEEINNKLDQMVADGTFEEIFGEYFRGEIDRLDNKIDDTAEELENEISTAVTAETNARTNADSNLQNQITGLASGAPIPVASTAAMTDTTKVYVNTTDGKWYYYDTTNTAWTAGGTYQSSGIATGSVNISSLAEKLLDKTFEKSTDITKLSLLRAGSSGNNITSAMYILAGTTVTFSSDFVANYKWHFLRLSYPAGSLYQNVNALTTDTSYTFTTDEWCVIEWLPIDGDWSTTEYTVDRKHMLDSDDVTSITYYYPKYNNITDGLDNPALAVESFVPRGMFSSGLMYMYENTRFGNTVAFKSNNKVKVTMNDDRFNFSVLKVSVSTDPAEQGYYHVIQDSGWLVGNSYEVEANTMFIISMKATDGSSIVNLTEEMKKALIITSYPSFSYVDSIVNQIPEVIPDYDKFVKGINHRGFNSIAPENTIPAFKLSAEEGFKYVESDVQFTSDSVPVMIHDATIDRTSDGTGNVADMTYSQISQYDFGSWKSSTYTGTKIPTLDEFLDCCKDCGLTPYIELKSDVAYTDAQYNVILNAVKNHGMKAKVTYISFSYEILQTIHAKDPKARLGFVMMYAPNDYTIEIMNSITGDNETFVDLYSELLTTENINKLKNNNIELETWTVDTEEAIVALDKYVNGVTSDSLIAGKVLFDEALGN